MSVFRWIKMIRLLLVISLLGVFLAFPAYGASGGTGTGGGTGGGRDEPLQLASSNPANGQKEVAVTISAITLTFNKNVINAIVRDANKRCFSMISADGKSVPIRVDMADDQIQPEKKREVFLVPLVKLQPGVAYTVKVAPALAAKSGATLEQEAKVTFTTAGQAVKSSNTVTETNIGKSSPESSPVAGKVTTGSAQPKTELTEEKPSETVSGPEASTVPNQAPTAAATAGDASQEEVSAQQEVPAATQSPVALWVGAGIILAALIAGGAWFIYGRNRK